MPVLMRDDSATVSHRQRKPARERGENAGGRGGSKADEAVAMGRF